MYDNKTQFKIVVREGVLKMYCVVRKIENFLSNEEHFKIL